MTILTVCEWLHHAPAGTDSDAVTSETDGVQENRLYVLPMR